LDNINEIHSEYERENCLTILAKSLEDLEAFGRYCLVGHAEHDENDSIKHKELELTNIEQNGYEYVYSPFIIKLSTAVL